MSKIIKFITNREEYYPNVYIFAYHLLKFFHKALISLKIMKPPRNKKDMFNWSLYHLHFKGELKVGSKKLTQSLKDGDYVFTDGKLLQKNRSIKPLHSGHKLLYETILQLHPSSVFEMGCGTGVHLHNLGILLPKATVCGIDLSERQLKGLKKDYPHLENAKQTDATIPFIVKPFDVCDIAFTQAVIMHIHTDNLYLIALENLFLMSKKYVILMEGIRSRNYMDDIQKLFDQGKIKWEKIFFYYRINEETGQANGIICSNTVLDYPELKDYGIFLPH